ncbi:bifunctional oligoribonuclease/PAP phosphatase NrnA [Streptococcus gallolyticus]|nr:bifunctional oligoribonuclease/PAP phosphatase NrnA [Streptococcus gallolyticus]MBY5041124.1 bifunctional oligoribonuclease/PAP phosphatase NrnA [Streptococcus gallolyticus]
MSVQEHILEKIKAYQTIIIHRHQRPDPDAIGSQLGLKGLIQKNFPGKRVLATGFQEPTLTWIGTMDEVADHDFDGALVIVVDTANTARIDDERYASGEFLIKIDHHPNDDVYGDVLWVDTKSSSACELISRFAMEQGLAVDEEIAACLYVGIVGDTGRFLYPATTTKTFEVAAFLRQFDIDFSGISRKMEEMDAKIAKLTGFVYDHMEVDENGAARVVLTRQIMAEYNVTDAETAAIVSAPGRIADVKAWAIFVEQENGSYRVRLRSKVVVINEIAKHHEGGGHPLASGANSYSLEENEQIFQEIKEAVRYARG